MNNYRFLESLLNDFVNKKLSYSDFIEKVENHYNLIINDVAAECSNAGYEGAVKNLQ